MHWIVLWAALLAGPYTFANPSEPSHIEIHAVETTDLHEFMHDAHEAFESEDPNAHGVRGFLKKWASAFNLPRMGVNAYRWYQLHKDDVHIKDHALNVAFMLSLSHSLEMSSGPLGISASHMMGLPGWVDWAVGSVGAVISIPGLDPLCIGLIAIYPKRQVRNAVQAARLFVVKISGHIPRVLGFNLLMHRFFTEMSGAERLFNALREGKHTIPVDYSNLTFHFRDSLGHPLVSLSLGRLKNDELVLESAHFSSELLKQPDFYSELKTSLKPFGWNIRDAVLQSMSMIQKDRADLLGHQVYVDQVAVAPDGWVDVKYKAASVSLKGRKVYCGAHARTLAKRYGLPFGNHP